MDSTATGPRPGNLLIALERATFRKPYFAPLTVAIDQRMSRPPAPKKKGREKKSSPGLNCSTLLYWFQAARTG
jgi:hypothetical protein